MIKLAESKRPEKIGETNNPNYYLYHWIIGHDTKDCYIFKNKIQALIKAGVIQLRAKQKRAMTNMATFQMGSLGWSILTPWPAEERESSIHYKEASGPSDASRTTWRWTVDNSGVKKI